MNKKRFRLIKGDIRKREDIKKALEDADALCHLAADVNIPIAYRKPFVCERGERLRNIKPFRGKVKRDVQRFVYVSTCGVYGNVKYLPINEKHPTDALLSASTSP